MSLHFSDSQIAKYRHHLKALDLEDEQRDEISRAILNAMICILASMETEEEDEGADPLGISADPDSDVQWDAIESDHILKPLFNDAARDREAGREKP